MNIDSFAYSLKYRSPLLFDALQRGTIWVTVLRHSAARRRALDRAPVQGTIGGVPAQVRPLWPTDAGELYRFLDRIPDEYLHYFRPHDFSPGGICRTIRSYAHCCYGLFVNEVLSGYALIKLFPTGRAYCGLLRSPGIGRRGVGRFLWRYLIWQCALMEVTPCATVHEENLASLGSLHSIKPATRQSSLAGNHLRLVIPVTDADRLPPELQL